MIMAAIAGLMAGWPKAVYMDDGIRGKRKAKSRVMLWDNLYKVARHPCPKTVSAAALKRAAKKRRNIRARSKK